MVNPALWLTCAGLLGLPILLAACASSETVPGVSAAPHRPVSWADIAALPLPPSGKRLTYGKGPMQFGELRVPGGPGPHPVAVVIHGGCWLSSFDYRHITNLAASLTNNGVATWTIAFRRVGDSRGGWPGTFQDVGSAVDHLRSLAPDWSLDLKRVIAVGHSAGGQLALWLAARPHQTGTLAAQEPLSVGGVVALAPITDLKSYAAGPDNSCGAAVKSLIGGMPAEHPERYAQVSPLELLPLRVPIRLIHGRHDSIVPLDMVKRFAERAEVAGDLVDLEVVGGSHFELLVPQSSGWPAVRDAALELTGLR